MDETAIIRITRLAVLLLLWCPVSVLAAETPAAFTGSYAVTARGYWSGTGTAAVGAQSVAIIIQVIDADGNKGTLKASNLTLANNRFTGTGTAGDQPITISGRLDPADGTVKAVRITCTYTGGLERNGRIVGDRRGH